MPEFRPPTFKSRYSVDGLPGNFDTIMDLQADSIYGYDTVPDTKEPPSLIWVGGSSSLCRKDLPDSAIPPLFFLDTGSWQRRLSILLYCGSGLYLKEYGSPLLLFLLLYRCLFWCALSG